MFARLSAMLGLALAVGWIFAAAAAPPSQGAIPGPEEALAKRLNQALAHRGLRGARVAAYVVDSETGEEIFARDPDRGLVPASNQKVLTALAALSAFGPTHRFITEVLADARPNAQGVVRRLVVVGGGDPALTSEDLWRLAADLRRLGLRRVAGPLLLDASRFDDERWHPDWGRTSARAYHAPVAGLTVNYGAFAVRIDAGRNEGDAVGVVIDPPVDYLGVVNRARTVSPRARTGLVVDRRSIGETEQVLVNGGLAAGRDPQLFHRSVVDPVLYAGAVLRMQLEANGIEVDGPVRRGAAPAEGVSLVRFEGKPLGEIVRLFVKYSNNAIAESLVKALGARASGAPGSWRSGVAALRQELSALGLPVDALTVVDGSGLSYANQVPPRVLVQALLVGRRSFRFGPEFVTALPIAAADGTLEERAEGAAGGVRAKTGLLTRVTGLSGYAHLADGRVAAFSVLANGFRGSAEAAMDGLDGFAAALVEAPRRLAQELRSP